MNENEEALEAIFNNNFTKKRGRKKGDKKEPNKNKYMYSLQIKPELADFFYNIPYITRGNKNDYINGLILEDALRRTRSKERRRTRGKMDKV